MKEVETTSSSQVPMVTVGKISRKPSVQIRPSRGMFHLDLHSVWQYRELLVFLVWRDTKVRYKQAVIGAGWAVFQPLISMLLFTAYLMRSCANRPPDQSNISPKTTPAGNSRPF